MDLLKPFKIAGKAVKNVVDGIESKIKDAAQDVEATDRVEKWKKKLSTALATHNGDQMDQREAMYLGNRAVDANINSKQLPTKLANNVNNIVFEFIETVVDTQIPQPSVKSKRPEFTNLANMIEDSVANDLPELGIEEINDYNERITPVQGFSVIEVSWNPDFKHHLYRGELELNVRHPKVIIKQPGVYKLQKMDYFFVLSSVTKEYIKRRYGVDVSTAEEQHKELTTMYMDNKNHTNSENELVTECVAWYKDEDGDICKYVWCDDAELEDLPKFYYRRYKRCKECNTLQGPDSTECECGSKKFKKTTEAVQVLDIDTKIGTGEVLRSGTEVPVFIPTRYPFVIRKNVPKNFSFDGQSDIDIIRDQQDSIKKAVTKAEEKVIKSGSVITTPDDLNFTITDGAYQTIKMSATQKNIFGVENLQADIKQELVWIEHQYKTAQSMLGITDAYQGKADPTAKSGVAKQIMVQQASGRLQSKQFNKYAAFKELFEIMFEFKLAFYDELRPYVAKDKDGKELFQNFDKYAFLIRDADGQFYFNTDFMFSADAGQGLPKDKIFLFNQAKEMYGAGAMDKLQYWTVLEGLNFPMAKQIKSQVEEQMQQEQALKQQTMQPIQTQQPPLSPEHQAMFDQLPPEVQQEIMNQAVGG